MIASPTQAHVQALRKAYLAHGYQPVAVYSRGKRPRGNDWQLVRGLPEFSEEALSTGINTTGLRAVDVDVDERADADSVMTIVEDVLGPAGLIRERPDSPRVLLLYCAAEGAPPKRTILLSCGKVEILGWHNQFVADGLHPQGQPYVWPNGSPDTLDRDSLPTVTEAQIDEVERRLKARFPDPKPEPEPEPEPEPPPHGSHRGNGHDERAERWARAALEDECRRVATAPKGRRNDTLNKAAHALSQIAAGGGLIEAEVRARLLAAALACGLPRPEAEATIASGLKAGAREPRMPPPPDPERNGGGGSSTAQNETSDDDDKAPKKTEKPIVPIPSSTLAELADQPEIERRFLDGGQRLPMRNVTLLSGDGGTGKSLVALQLALATSARDLVSPPLQWLGSDLLETGTAVYIAAEDEGLEVRRRLAQMCRLADLDPHRVDRLHIISLAEEADTTLAIEERGVLKATALFRRIEARLALIPEIKLVIVDNVADVFGANEIVRHLVRAFLSLWRGIAIHKDCAVLMLFHPSQAGLRDGTGTSGSTGWHNSVKSRLYLDRIRDETGQEPDQDRRRLRAMKSNYAALGEDIELVYDQGQFVATAVERPFDNVTVAHLNQVRAAFATGTYKVSSQASEWGGFFVADLLGLPVGRGLKVAELNPDEKKNRRRVGTIIAQWIRAQEICTVQKRDERRHKTPHYGVPGVTRGDD